MKNENFKMIDFKEVRKRNKYLENRYLRKALWKAMIEYDIEGEVHSLISDFYDCFKILIKDQEAQNEIKKVATTKGILHTSNSIITFRNINVK